MLKQLYTAVLVTATVGTLNAQPDAALQGTVEYEEVARIDPPSIPQGRGLVVSSAPRERRSAVRLRFQGDVTRSESVPDAAAGVVSYGAVLYFDRGSGRRLSQVSLGGEPFLVGGPIEPIRWRVTGEEGEYLGYPVLRATAAVGSQAVEAWFTPAVPAPVGPALYHGLPGLILVVTVDEGKRAFRATGVSLAPLDGPVLAPTEGRAVTSEEYDGIVARYVERSRRALEESEEADH